MLRRGQLCPGAWECPEVEWTEGPDPAPCAECPRQRLDTALQFTEAGRAVTDALALDWALRCGLQIAFETVSYPEFLRLRILNEERQTHELEQIKRQDAPREPEWMNQRGRK